MQEAIICRKTERNSPEFERAIEALSSLYRPNPALESLLEAEADRLLAARLQREDSDKGSCKSPPSLPVFCSSLQTRGGFQSWLVGLKKRLANNRPIPVKVAESRAHPS